MQNTGKLCRKLINTYQAFDCECYWNSSNFLLGAIIAMEMHVACVFNISTAGVCFSCRYFHNCKSECIVTDGHTVYYSK